MISKAFKKVKYTSRLFSSGSQGQDNKRPITPDDLKVYYQNFTYNNDVKSIKNTGLIQGSGILAVAFGLSALHWVPGIFVGALGLGMMSGTYCFVK